MSLIRISQRLRKEADDLSFGPPITHVYNPLNYARRTQETYLKRFGTGPKEAIFVGMNPGPWGMAQTGVPFGEVSIVRDWMGIEAPVSKPIPEHPKRPVDGFACTRSEVSGARLWGWARERFKTPERFFERFFVWNFCPLSFMEESGRNFTPDKLPKAEQAALFDACDRALGGVIKALKPKYVIGVGTFAEKQIQKVVNDEDVIVGRILHPSPASPAANKDWAGQAEKNLKDIGIRI